MAVSNGKTPMMLMACVICVVHMAAGQDNEPPVMTCPGNINQTVESGTDEATIDWDPLPSANDLEDGILNVTCTYEVGEAYEETKSGDTFPVGVTVITCSASDSNSATGECYFNITVIDNEAPRMACSDNINENVDTGMANATVDWSPQPSADDIVDGLLNVTCKNDAEMIVMSGDRFPVGETQVTCSATDDSGNSGSCDFVITVTDNEGPVMTCSNNKTQNVDPGMPNATVTWSPPPTADDVVDGLLNVTCKDSTDMIVMSGDRFPVGETQVTCSATDESGNSGSCDFVITVVDNEGPVMTCSNNIIVDVDEGMADAVVDWSPQPSADDVVDGEQNVTCEDANDQTVISGEIFPVGETTVTCSASDSKDNVGSCEFIIIVQDDEPPVMTCPESFPQNVNRGKAFATVFWDPVPSANDTVDGPRTVTCKDGSDAVVESGGTFPVGVSEITCSALDESGNEGRCNFNITVVDIEKPNITCPEDGSVNVAEGKDTASVTWVTTASDIVDGLLEPICDPKQGSVFTSGDTVVNCTAYDKAMNSESCSFTVTVTDDGVLCPGNPIVGCNCDESRTNCICKDEISGDNCDVTDGSHCLTEDPSSNPNCECTEGTCGCKPGFKGNTCDDCKGCLNGGKNQDFSTCECECLSDGYKAPLCSGCMPCVNGTNQNETCVCECYNLFKGDLCNVCPGNIQCANGGTFDEISCRCACAYPWTGPTCTECMPCENEGTDQDKSTCMCNCPSGFLQPLCSVCSECENGGSFQNAYTCACECPNLYTGLLCSVCPGDVCLNGGEMDAESCSCNCADGWTGKNCKDPVPDVPDDEYPEPPPGEPPIKKTVAIEIAVTTVVFEGKTCNVTVDKLSAACTTLVNNFKNEVRKAYSRLAGFDSVEVNQADIKAGSVIVPHEVIYNYGEMTAATRGYSAGEVYDQTVAQEVGEGKLGSLEVTSDCPSCKAPEDKTNMCKTKEPQCKKGFQLTREEREEGACYYVCRADCKVESTYCNEGTCNQDSDGVKSCSCPQSEDFMYIGVNCQLKVELLWLYVGCGIGGGVLLLLIIGLICCVVKFSGRAKKLEKMGDEMEEGSEMRQEVRAVHNKGFERDLSITEEQGTSSSPPEARPYSYIYRNGTGVGVSRSSSGAGAPRNRLEATEPRDQDRDASSNDQGEETAGGKKRGAYFWGNLTVPDKEDAEMIPMTSGIDPTKMYKIQRPQISMHKNDDLPDRDYF